MRRVLNISGPGVATDEAFCPHCQVMFEEGDGSQVCRLCRDDTRQPTGPATHTHPATLDQIATTS
jgi:hypothetical protein